MRHQNLSIVLRGLLLFLAVFILSFGCSDNESEQMAKTIKTPMEMGEELYVAYCAICHGEKGKGDGAYAEILKIPPSDLTTIRKRYDGNFPENMLRDVISGESRVDGHGSAMPVWSETFMKGEHLNTRQEVDAKIAQLVSYIRSLQ